MTEDVVAVELIALKNFIAPQDTEDVEGQVLLANLALLSLGVQQATKTLFVFADDSIMNTVPTLTDINSEVYDICLLNNKADLNFVVLNRFQNQIPKGARFICPPNSVVTKLISRSISTNFIDIGNALNEVLFGQPFRLFKSNEVFCTKKYDYIVIGGTFDRFHGGHKQLLSAALLVCNKLLMLGVTKDVMLKGKKDANKIQDIAIRKQNVVEFCRVFKPEVKLELHEISDPYGPSIIDARLQAIVVSSETLKGAREVNQRRKKSSLNTLDCIAVRRTNAFTLSSTFLRNIEDKPKL